MQRTNDYRRSKLRAIASALQDWEQQVLREKGVFHTLNLFNYDVTHKCTPPPLSSAIPPTPRRRTAKLQKRDAASAATALSGSDSSRWHCGSAARRASPP